MALKDLSIKTMKIFNMNDSYENQQVTNGASDAIRILNAKLYVDSKLPVIFNQFDTDENQQVTNKLVDAVKELEKSFESISGLNVDFATKAYPILDKNSAFENMDVTNRLVAVIDELSTSIEKYLENKRSGDGQSVEAGEEPGSSSMSDSDAIIEYGESSDEWDIVGRCMCSDPECQFDCASGDIMVMGTGTYSTDCDESGNHLIKLAGPFDSYEAAYASLYANHEEYEEALIEQCEQPCDGLRLQGSLSKNCSGDCSFDICISGATSTSYINTQVTIPGTHLDGCGNPMNLFLQIAHYPGQSLSLGIYNYSGSAGSECCIGNATGDAKADWGSGNTGNILTYPSGVTDRYYSDRFGWQGGNRETGFVGGICSWLDSEAVAWPVHYKFSE